MLNSKWKIFMYSHFLWINYISQAITACCAELWAPEGAVADAGSETHTEIHEEEAQQQQSHFTSIIIIVDLLANVNEVP